MTCDTAREHLADHLLGTLDRDVDVDVVHHLRGCAACRAELQTLADGVGTFARASHDVAPPPELRTRIMDTLDGEWAEMFGDRDAGPVRRGEGRPRRWATASLVAALIASVAWGAVATVQALSNEDAASRYEAFLAELGGESVRVGTLRADGNRDVGGSVVVYESRSGQSWALVLCRAPGWEGTINVTMLAGDELRIDLRPIEFGPGGEGSTWLVTGSDLAAYDRVNLWTDEGLVASAELETA